MSIKGFWHGNHNQLNEINKYIYEKIIKVYLKLVNMVMIGGQRKNELTLLIPRYLNPYISYIRFGE